MLYVYSAKAALKPYPDRNFLVELCDKAETDEVDKAFRFCGYSKTMAIGDEDAAEIELYISNTDTEFKAIVHITLGDSYQEYAMVSFHDALEFMKEYTPTIKAIVDLHDRNELVLDKLRSGK